ncbi:MAG: double-strand break repair helicase AddA [Hyphomicrobium sp.]|uniref:double-strand break repair helicase AddA n=1 Tax=Hyphomicrobium sp. TaxID=82 RepID=UPI003568E8D9
MNLETKRLSLDALRQETDRQQGNAADPLASAWVKANAGTGKTHVLTLRVLRLLLAGTSPEKILCLTYTKAAAAEMSRRVFDRLAGWVTTDAKALKEDIVKVTGGDVSVETLQLARRLFANAIETPGGLKVQTIHAFAERLLQRFPLESGVPPDFKILDDAAAKDLKARAIEQTLLDATSNPETPLGRALDIIVRYATDTQFEKLISNAVEERRWLDVAKQRESGAGATLADVTAIETHLRASLGVRAAIAVRDIYQDCACVLSDADLRELAEHLATGKASDIGHVPTLQTAAGLTDAQRRFEALSNYFLTTEGEPRKSLMTKALASAKPGLNDRCLVAQQRLVALANELRALTLVESSMALYAFAGIILQRYTEARRSAGALDFADLILKTKSLLEGKGGQAQWVLYKLDGGLDHVLVDEAQDTSPEQWDIVKALANEFFIGAATRDGSPRTVFAVGDEKQSIYSFQGADPKMFADAGTRFAALARDAGLVWKPIELTMSFRTVTPVLAAVDAVFADAEKTPGLTAGGPPPKHNAIRLGQAGLVEIWPTEKSDELTAADPWAPLTDTSERSPANRLAEHIADTIKGWLDSGEHLVSQGRPIRAGDILILVRKRNPFAVPMVAALKRRGIAVAGSDRIALTDQIAVQDLMALGDFLILPEDDLALACVLKGPIFGFDDNDLLAIAPGRKSKTLWSALLDNTDVKSEYKLAAETLKRWRAKADFTPPFEFFSSVLDRDGAREKMLCRLGPEAADVIDEFLDLALSYDDGTPPSLTQFLAELRAVAPEVKRDMDHGRDEVRVMTVHGAKGLEAPIVFLPDTCTTASGDISAASLVRLPRLPRPDNIPEPIVWTVKRTSRIEAVVDARRAREGREHQERNRLLYVAMTRARDRLYIAGFEGKKGRADFCWYDAISDALLPIAQEIEDGGKKIWRIETGQTAELEKPREEKTRQRESEARPAFASKPARPEPKLSVPLAPSRLEPYAPDAEGEPIMPVKADAAATYDAPSPLAGNSEHRFLRGTLTHALLQHLPAVAANDRETIATAFVAKRGAPLSQKARAGIVQETLAILSSTDFAPLFGPNSMAEVPIAAVIPRPKGSGPALDLSGQIDRLAVTDEEVLIVDYKTNRPPPSDVRFVAAAYLYQLAAYRLALGEIYPGRRVRAALLWTDGPRLMEVPEDVLDGYQSRLWDLDVQSLDAP